MLIPFVVNILRLLQAIRRPWGNPSFRGGSVLAVLILLSGTVLYRTVEGWSWIDALCFSVTTVSTVGFADLSPQTDTGKLFTVLYIFVGVGVFVALFTQFAQALLHVDKQETERLRRP